MSLEIQEYHYGTLRELVTGRPHGPLANQTEVWWRFSLGDHDLGVLDQALLALRPFLDLVQARNFTWLPSLEYFFIGSPTPLGALSLRTWAHDFIGRITEALIQDMNLPKMNSV